MSRLRFIALAVLMTIIALGFSPNSPAQTKSTTTSLFGTVTDPSGARIPNATVRITHPETGIVRTNTTTATGEFSFAFLPVGTYILEASSPGFTTTKQDGIVLTGGDTVNLNIGLTIGASEQVVVNTAEPLLQTQDANISLNVSGNQQIE